MKCISVFLLTFLTALIAAAQSNGAGAAPAAAEEARAAAPVVSLEWESDSHNDMEKSADVWEKLVEANSTNEDAWLNFYKARRAMALLEDGAKPGKRNQSELNTIIGRMSNAVPSSYAFNYCNYVNGNKSDESFAYLKNAIALRPNDKELWDDMLCNAVLSENTNEIKSWVKKMNDARLFTWGEVEYNRNTLNSVEQNGVLLTNGNVDTTPLYMLQSEGFRTDVIIVCLDWIGSARYLHLLEAKLKVSPGVIKLNDAQATYNAVMNLGKKRAVYTALTVPKSLMSSYISQLYCTGLALKYSETPINNLSSLVYNWESLFQKNYWSSSDALTRNYLLPAQLLLSYYNASGAKDKSAELQKLIEQKKRIPLEPYIQR